MSDAPRSALDTERPDPRFWGRVDPADDMPHVPARPAPWGGPLERALDRFRDVRTDPKFGIAALLVVALAAGFVWYRMGVSSAPAERSSRAPTSAVSVPLATTTTTDQREVTVHVAGAVVTPGVFELSGASRVIDAVEAAGGGAAEADLDRLNLASKLVDGQRVLVQKIGDPAAPATPSGTTGSDSGTVAVPGELVNLNTAAQAELETLPGIGPTLAQAIISERDRRGGFRSVNELRSVRGIGDKRFADVQPLVTI